MPKIKTHSSVRLKEQKRIKLEEINNCVFG